MKVLSLIGRGIPKLQFCVKKCKNWRYHFYAIGTTLSVMLTNMKRLSHFVIIPTSIFMWQEMHILRGNHFASLLSVTDLEKPSLNQIKMRMRP